MQPILSLITVTQSKAAWDQPCVSPATAGNPMSRGVLREFDLQGNIHCATLAFAFRLGIATQQFSDHNFSGTQQITQD